MEPFLIIGQPRSGTSYLQTLLNAHPQVHCWGELFHQSEIHLDGRIARGLDAVIARDADPEGFLDRMLSGEGLQRRENLRAIGAKLLVHHNAAVLTRHIPARPFLRLIHVRRENKLAQFASLQQASKTGRWVATEASEAPKIAATPFAAASACHRLENEDVLLDAWLRSLPNPMLSVTYRELFHQTFAGRVQDFLGVDASAEMRSPLAKQGQNRIIDRFAEPEEIERYFRETGRADWLGPEL